MKKVLLLLGVCSIFSLSSCNDTNNCMCTIEKENGQVYASDIKVSDSEKSCDEISWNDLDSTWSNTNIAGGYVLVCTDN